MRQVGRPEVGTEACCATRVHRFPAARPLLRAGIASALMLATLTGCGQRAKSDAEKGTLNVYLNRDPGGYDALKRPSATKASIQTQMPVYEMLFDMDPKTGKVTPNLGLSATSSEGGRIWTVKLRPNVRFSNGEPFTAEAYVVHFARLMKSPMSGVVFNNLGARIVGVTAISPLEVRFELASPKPQFEIMMATPGIAWFGINAPKHTLAHGDDPDFDLKPVGTGPYMLESFRTGVGLTYVKNPYYRNPSVQHLNRITYHVMGEGLASYVALKAGDIDMLYAADDLTVVRALRDPDVKTIVGQPDFQGFRINLNTRSGPLADIRVRQALAYALNREAANKIWSQGLAEIATDAYGKRSAWYCPGIRYPEYDPAKARALLKAYGKPVRLRLGIMSFSSKFAEIAQAMWKDVGIDVALEVETPGPGFYRKASSGAFDMWYGPGGSNRNPLLVDLDLASDNRANPMGIRSKAIDDAIAQIIATHDRDSLYRASCQYQQILADELPFIRFTFAPNAVVMRKSVEGPRTLTSADAEYYKARIR
ncbi:ABC transporter substrate-binding protein [Sphingobium chungangianum]